MNSRSLQNAFFLGLVLLTTVAFLWLVRGFLMPVFWAIVLAVLFHRLYERLHARTGRRSVASLLTLLVILVMVVLPFTFIGWAVVNETTNLYVRISSGEIDVRQLFEGLEEQWPLLSAQLDRLGVEVEDLRQRLSGAAMSVSSFLAGQALSFGQNALRITVLFFLMLYFLFFFLRDGDRLVAAAVRALPLGDRRERRLLSKFAQVSRATIKGTLVVGLVQGTIGGLLFWMLGLEAPVFWGVIMTVLSLLPAVGAALVWLPAAILLILSGSIGKGIVLLVGGTLVIGLVDNLLRPLLVGRDTRMPDFLILLSTLGGLAVFGISGFVIGPIIAAFFLTVWSMFTEEFAPFDDPEVVARAARPEVPPPPPQRQVEPAAAPLPPEPSTE